MNKSDLKGLWMPSERLINNKLSDKEKIILSMIIYLSKDKGYCFATNNYFSDIHFLIRGLRYIDEENAAFGNISNSIVTYKELFKILKDNINLDAIFDEEEMYNKIGKEK